ncbi:hypothetical protein JYU34_003955 [Plutella xylostella]|uniref:Uncharacterized protein n=1 Tax=Plutella xylostella TaxID=51655 RepID=A0ABQ7R1A3_PLUXY|nr:hypothetical protein JYU34_003955 [Plutella xylostella]
MTRVTGQITNVFSVAYSFSADSREGIPTDEAETAIAGIHRVSNGVDTLPIGAEAGDISLGTRAEAQGVSHSLAT